MLSSFIRGGQSQLGISSYFSDIILVDSSCLISNSHITIYYYVM